MKAILEFNLEDSQDRLAHLRCTKAMEAYLVIHDFSEELRRLRKYHESEDVNIEELSKKFFEILEDRDINLDHLE